MGLRKASDSNPLHPVQERDYPRDLRGLLAQLADGDASVRRWAARDLAQHAEAAPTLARRLAEEPDARVREVIFTSLSSIGGPVAVDAFLPLLRSEDASMRNSAIEGLSHLPGEASSRIDALLRDPDADVRIFTVNLLGLLHHGRIGAWLARVLREESEVNVVGAAVEVVTEVGGTEHLEPLEAARRRFADDPFIGFAIDVARARIEAA